MNDMAMTKAYAGPPMKRMHPEFGDGECTAATPTVAASANRLTGQLNEAIERASRILDSITGPKPMPGGCDEKSGGGLDNAMRVNVGIAATLLKILEELEARIGG